MSTLDRLKNALEASAQVCIKDIPAGLMESCNVAKLYASYEVKEEFKRLNKAIDKRIEDGVNGEQIMNLLSDIKRTFLNIPLLERRVEDLKVKLSELEEIDAEDLTDKEEKSLKSLSQSIVTAKEKLEKTRLKNNDYKSLLKSCGVVIEGVNSDE